MWARTCTQLFYFSSGLVAMIGRFSQHKTRTGEPRTNKATDQFCGCFCHMECYSSIRYLDYFVWHKRVIGISCIVTYNAAVGSSIRPLCLIVKEVLGSIVSSHVILQLERLECIWYDSGMGITCHMVTLQLDQVSIPLCVCDMKEILGLVVTYNTAFLASRQPCLIWIRYGDYLSHNTLQFGDI